MILFVNERSTLRDYQKAAVARTIDAIDRRPVLVLPTGGGKSLCATTIVERLGVPTIWLAHRKELVDQAAAHLWSHGLDVGLIKAGYKPRNARVQVASIQSLVRRKKPPARLIVVDECHRAIARSYRNIFDAYPGAWLVGLTATPFRLDGRGLGAVFGELIVAAWTDELCDAGVLHAPKVFASKSPDLNGVRIVAGDYNLADLGQRVNEKTLYGDIVETWQKRAAGRRTVAFAVDVRHSRAIVAAFRDAGIPAEHLDGKTKPDERDAILRRLRTGETQVVSNCLVLTEGWDLPALECAILARPTASLNLHLQMIGRVMRACEGKDGAIVLDHAGNHHIHGLVTRRLDYRLTAEKLRFDEPLGLRRCAECGLLYELHKQQCPECGAMPKRDERKAAPVRATGELIEFEESRFEYRESAWRSIETMTSVMQESLASSKENYLARFGEWPVVEGRQLVNPKCATFRQKRGVYAELLEVAKARKYKPGWASHRYRQTFGVWPSGFVTEVKREVLEAAA